MVLTVSFAISLVIGLDCHHRRRDAKHHRQLDASVEASGPRDFAVRDCAVRQKRSHRPPHPRPTFVTIAKRPFCVGRDGAGYGGDLGQKGIGIFLPSGLDRGANQSAGVDICTTRRVARQKPVDAAA
jgi:hypothetical protein